MIWLAHLLACNACDALHMSTGACFYRDRRLVKKNKEEGGRGCSKSATDANLWPATRNQELSQWPVFPLNDKAQLSKFIYKSEVTNAPLIHHAFWPTL